MPTEEEICAIVALANKAKIKYGRLYDTQNQYETVIKFANKWFEQRRKNSVRANEWNKNHADAHKKHNKEYYERKKNDKQEK